MGCLNSKSSTADGKAESKLPPKENKAAPASRAGAAPTKPTAAAAAQVKPPAASAPKQAATKKVAASDPKIKNTPAPAESAKKADAAPPQDTTSAPHSVPSTAPPSAAKNTTPDEKTAATAAAAKSATPAAEKAPGGGETGADAEKPANGGELATILRKQIEDYEARHQPEGEEPPLADDEKQGSASGDQNESALLPEEEAEIKEAASSYNASYKERMGHMKAPRSEDNAAPFIGFSLADNIKEGALVVDGVFHDGPAYQVGVDIDHELVSIAGRAARGILATRELVGKYCHPGHITKFKFRNPSGDTYEAPLYVLTADPKYQGKPYYFDTTQHKITQSDRLKQTWRASSSPNR